MRNPVDFPGYHSFAAPHCATNNAKVVKRHHTRYMIIMCDYLGGQLLPHSELILWHERGPHESAFHYAQILKYAFKLV